ncbi:hypothetical protein [Virgibacillus necropolis]|uniref:Uncharacterized protein n=1 Tax=Virgibacillus necropolis TaxID=163877 RepID=A0A221ME49_9BACI|nr:hypothetical protein [Virgibacillus necropolis]ASN05925.1 hypothetical protein CFK40_13325 [Virgibacillus necropolis]
MEQLVWLLSFMKNSPYGLMTLIVIGMLICYLSIKPVIHWFVTLKQDRILSYIMCSFIILICSILIGFLFFQTDYLYLIKITLLCMAVFGGILVIVRLLHFIFQNVFMKNV